MTLKPQHPHGAAVPGEATRGRTMRSGQNGDPPETGTLTPQPKISGEQLASGRLTPQPKQS